MEMKLTLDELLAELKQTVVDAMDATTSRELLKVSNYQRSLMTQVFQIVRQDYNL
jgi:hypothetical protein